MEIGLVKEAAPRDKGLAGFRFPQDINRKVMIRRSHSEYPATKDKPEIIHNDLMVVYLDNANKPNNAVYFDNEGHTISYSVAYSGGAIILTSHKTENALIFRLTYIPLDMNSVDVKFEMSQDGEKFFVYTEGKCKRKK